VRAERSLALSSSRTPRNCKVAYMQAVKPRPFDPGGALDRFAREDRDIDPLVATANSCASRRETERLRSAMAIARARLRHWLLDRSFEFHGDFTAVSLIAVNRRFFTSEPRPRSRDEFRNEAFISSVLRRGVKPKDKPLASYRERKV